MELGETKEVVTTDGRRLVARRLELSDGQALRNFNSSLSTQSEIFFRPHSYDEETVGKVLARSVAGDDLVLGLFDGARMAGYFFLWYVREPVPLLGIGLQDAYHGRGLGRRLMELLVDEARAAGKDGIELTTNLVNNRAFALYKKMGFRYYRDVPNLQGDGSIVTERAMFYPLKPGAHPPDIKHRPPV